MIDNRIIGGCALAAALCAGAAPALAQPTFGNPSPNAGSSTSQQANAAADVAAYQEVAYTNKAKRGPALVVIPGVLLIALALVPFKDKHAMSSVVQAAYRLLDRQQAKITVRVLAA